MLRPSHPIPPRAGERGFSLIELMIAILIALFLLGGLVTLLIGTRRTTATQTALSQLQDNERIAMTLITNIVQKAGYFPYPTPTAPQNPTGQTAGSFVAEASLAGVTFVNGQFLSGQYNAAAPGDVLAVRFFAPATDTASTVINCAGQSNTGNQGNLEYANAFKVATVNGTSWLQCLTRTNTDGLGAVGAVLTVNLIPNVTQIAVLYGISTNVGGDDYSVIQYVTANQLTGLTWPNVTSVKVTLTFQLPVLGTTGGQMSSSPTQVTTFTRVIPIMSRTGVNT